ncbi:hypothetical protein EVAR_51498_1 [Eumeta japonica]|uniref:Uncharacterized protein n=1 Tax=Eumeta variegata TaxID=151549 RepID=A0A4C1XFF7_EUMVA|nr:hypothetical protein EVAR_51498_1 [Eumeta japonica]
MVIERTPFINRSCANSSLGPAALSGYGAGPGCDFGQASGSSPGFDPDSTLGGPSPLSDVTWRGAARPRRPCMWSSCNIAGRLCASPFPSPSLSSPHRPPAFVLYDNSAVAAAIFTVRMRQPVASTDRI